MGFDVFGFNDVFVIKIGGGERNCGNVFGEVDVDRYFLDISYYGRIVEKVFFNDVVLNLVFGVYKFFLVFERRGVFRFVKNIVMFEGDKRRIVFYFINWDVVEMFYFEFLFFLEEIVSMVMNWFFEGEEFVFYVLKFVNLNIMGKGIFFIFDEIFFFQFKVFNCFFLLFLVI